MIDFMANHVGPHHTWLNEADKNEWFKEKKAGTYDTNLISFEMDWLDSLPELKTENPEVKSYLLDVARWWIQETNIDGYRLVNMEDVETDFWQDFFQVVKAEKADFYLIGDRFMQRGRRYQVMKKREWMRLWITQKLMTCELPFLLQMND